MTRVNMPAVLRRAAHTLEQIAKAKRAKTQPALVNQELDNRKSSKVKIPSEKKPRAEVVDNKQMTFLFAAPAMQSTALSMKQSTRLVQLAKECDRLGIEGVLLKGGKNTPDEAARKLWELGYLESPTVDCLLDALEKNLAE